MSLQSRDLIVLGGGPGGYVAAIRAAQLGRNVTLVEREALGGVCLNWGCIPSKALLKSAEVFAKIQEAAEFGIEVSKPKADFVKIIDRSRDVANKISGGVSYLMRKNKIEVVLGEGRLKKGNLLTVKDRAGKEQSYSYKDIIIATGARARALPGFEVDGESVHNYRTALACRKQPKKLLIIGAGAIGMEFGYFYSALGSQVTIVEMLDQVLPIEDSEVGVALQKNFEKKGVTIKLGSAVGDLKRETRGGLSVLLKAKSGGEERWSGDMLLVAIGFVPNTENLGLEDVGIATDRGFIKVDSSMRTNVPNHYAIGDVIGAPMLAHVASHEGLVAAEVAAGKSLAVMHYDNVPGCTYCQPQVASVGLTEKLAKERGLKYRVGKIPFSAIGKAVAISESEGFIKVLIDDEVGEVLGVHIIHPEATELISEAALIRSHEGIAASVVDTIHPHPTLSESMAEAMALALGRPINF
ncbi:MAG TPA: dihydrolipoyl dehydrogenase [Oligoflexia bacterium]|nr:dihydrolipoyl dehydrogenase [Oligoflexia bacterium]HMP26385.1 dihydrolipoyl dehydrogenase [Oligoflexia bacterium]